MSSFYVAAEPRGETHPVDEVLPAGKLAIYGAQHVLAFYAGAVIVPILLASAIGLKGEDLVYLISADLFTCGIASLIQSVGFWKVGVRLPLLQGVTFTAVAPMISIGNANGGGVHGLLAIYGAVIFAGVVTFLMAPYFSKLLKLFPPVVTGTVITVIGITLLPVAAQMTAFAPPAAASVIATVMPRSLNDPVGFAPSILRWTSQPVSDDRCGAGSSGVPPSRRVTTSQPSFTSGMRSR